jgi:hypothetical protein
MEGRNDVAVVFRPTTMIPTSLPGLKAIVISVVTARGKSANVGLDCSYSHGLNIPAFHCIGVFPGHASQTSVSCDLPIAGVQVLGLERAEPQV